MEFLESSSTTLAKKAITTIGAGVHKTASKLVTTATHPISRNVIQDHPIASKGSG
jgi:hypothetical protein